MNTSPVAWRWRHVNAASLNWNYQDQPIRNHNEYLVVEPLYVNDPAALVDLVQTMLDNDPDEPIADNGMTVLDGWRDRARGILGLARGPVKP